MTHTRPRFVLFLVLLFASSPTFAQSFSGPYVGVETGMQHLIGGSLVNGVDTLQDDSRLVSSIFGGLRVQSRGFVIGGELGRGRTDGDLRLEERSFTVDYRNGSQWHWTLQAGRTVAARTLVFGYVSEVTRAFDVTITQSGQTVAQEDEQGMLRFGAGLEWRLTGLLHLRATAGTSRANFGERPLNKTVGRRAELSAGIVVQF